MNEMRRLMTLCEAKMTPAERFVEQISKLLNVEPGVRAAFRAEDTLDVAFQRLSVRPRNSGLGSWAMQIITRLADKLGVELYGEALAEEDDMEQERLVEFYRRYGFQVANDGMMWRPPKRRRGG